jgi:hypothetical protein
VLTVELFRTFLLIALKNQAVFPNRDHQYHHWYHTGEAHAIRQLLGHPDLPQFVGDMSEALYRPER